MQCCLTNANAKVIHPQITQFFVYSTMMEVHHFIISEPSK